MQKTSPSRDDDVLVDGPVGRVGTVQGEAVVRGHPWLAGPSDPEVIDLLVVDRALGRVVVLVGWVRRPVAVRRQHLDAHQSVGPVEDARRHEIGHLSGGRAGPPDLDGHVLCAHPHGFETPRRPRRRQRDLDTLGPIPASPRSRWGRSAQSVTWVNTLSRPSSRSVRPSTSTSRAPESGSTAISSAPVATSIHPPGASRATRKPAEDQPATVGGEEHVEVPVGQRTGRPVQPFCLGHRIRSMRRLHREGPTPRLAR